MSQDECEHSYVFDGDLDRRVCELCGNLGEEELRAENFSGGSQFVDGDSQENKNSYLSTKAWAYQAKKIKQQRTQRIENVCELLRLSAHITKTAIALWDKIRHMQNSEVLLSACVYAACRLEKQPITLREVAVASQCDWYLIGRKYKELKKTFQLKLPRVSPVALVDRTFTSFFPEPSPAQVYMRVHAKQLVVFTQKWMLDQGIRAEVICAATLSLALEGNNVASSFSSSSTNGIFAKIEDVLMVCHKHVRMLQNEIEERLKLVCSFINWSKNALTKNRKYLLSLFPSIMKHIGLLTLAWSVSKIPSSTPSASYPVILSAAPSSPFSSSSSSAPFVVSSNTAESCVINALTSLAPSTSTSSVGNECSNTTTNTATNNSTNFSTGIMNTACAASTVHIGRCDPRNSTRYVCHDRESDCKIHDNRNAVISTAVIDAAFTNLISASRNITTTTALTTTAGTSALSLLPFAASTTNAIVASLPSNLSVITARKRRAEQVAAVVARYLQGVRSPTSSCSSLLPIQTHSSTTTSTSVADNDVSIDDIVSSSSSSFSSSFPSLSETVANSPATTAVASSKRTTRVASVVAYLKKESEKNELETTKFYEQYYYDLFCKAGISSDNTTLAITVDNSTIEHHQKNKRSKSSLPACVYPEGQKRGWTQESRSAYILAIINNTTESVTIGRGGASSSRNKNEMLEVEHLIRDLLRVGVKEAQIANGFCTHVRCVGRFFCVDITPQLFASGGLKHIQTWEPVLQKKTNPQSLLLTQQETPVFLSDSDMSSEELASYIRNEDLNDFTKRLKSKYCQRR